MAKISEIIRSQYSVDMDGVLADFWFMGEDGWC